MYSALMSDCAERAVSDASDGAATAAAEKNIILCVLSDLCGCF